MSAPRCCCCCGRGCCPPTATAFCCPGPCGADSNLKLPLLFLKLPNSPDLPAFPVGVTGFCACLISPSVARPTLACASRIGSTSPPPPPPPSRSVTL
eukprot:1621298-Rhodomonas_salina.1